MENFNNITLQEFIDICKSEKVQDVLKLGATKEIELYTGEKVNIMIAGFKHDVTEDKTKANVSLIFKFPFDGEWVMNNEWSNKGGWDTCYFRNVLIPRFFKLLPIELQKAIIPVVKKTSVGDGKGKIKTSIDKLFLLSEKELTGTNNYSYIGEGKQYELFKRNQDLIGCGKWFWLRSPNRGHATYFCYVYNVGYININIASSTNCARLGFCL